jgi:hypothetical protein
VIIPASDGSVKLTCLVTADALNDRLGYNIIGEEVLVLLVHLREEIEMLLQTTHELGGYTLPGEIRLTTRELHR